MTTQKYTIRIKTPNDTEVKNKQIEKKCTVCGETKALSEFYKRGGKCKECTKILQRERNETNKKKRIQQENDPEQMSKPKKCETCRKTKTVKDFRMNRLSCLDCEREYGRKYGKEHPEIRRTWHENNIERHSELNAKNYQLHKKEINDKLKNRYHNDKCYRIHKTKQRNLQRIIKKFQQIGGKTKHIQLFEWFEYNFTEEMTWNNHGTYWDIDHVIPVDKWNLEDEEQVKLCFDWKNLMPIKCKYNRNKKNKLTKEQLLEHRKRLRKYYKEKELDDDERKTYFKIVIEIISLNGQDTLLRETP